MPDKPDAPPEPQDVSIAQAIAEVSERAQLLVREEIELAKAEVSAKVSKLVKGAVVGMAAGIFVVTGLMFSLHAAAWGVYTFFGGTEYWVGFAIVAGALFLLGALAGMLAYRAVRTGAPPVPSMAIDEAKKIRETVTGSEGTP
ncbi:MAG TPA: phage holin family protein [Conexibacter sp.]|nr:phage holin family protein [Conexibacter sp.]